MREGDWVGEIRENILKNLSGLLFKLAFIKIILINLFCTVLDAKKIGLFYDFWGLFWAFGGLIRSEPLCIFPWGS